MAYIYNMQNAIDEANKLAEHHNEMFIVLDHGCDRYTILLFKDLQRDEESLIIYVTN